MLTSNVALMGVAKGSVRCGVKGVAYRMGRGCVRLVCGTKGGDYGRVDGIKYVAKKYEMYQRS